LSGAAVHELLVNSASCTDPAALLEQREAIQAVDDLLDTIPAREAEILRMRFGIDCQPMPLEELAKAKGYTRERIRQIEMKALAKLRKPCRGGELLAARMGLFGEAP
jgi:RNA polymerase primary sigma factor